MTTTVIPIAEGFTPATRAQWLGLVAKTLKGAGPESLISRTADGVEIQPLYAADNAAVAPAFPPAHRGGERAWDVRAAIRHPDRATAHALILESLAGGAGSVLISLDPSGARGVAVGDAEALAELLEDVMTDLAPVALDAGFMGAIAADWLAVAAKSSPSAPLAFHMDPLAAFARSGASPGPIEDHIAASAKTGARLADTFPKAGLFLAGAAVVHEAGGAPADELAFALASALAYAKALTLSGLPTDEAFRRIVLGLAIDQRPLISIAKLRAARVLWRQLTTACGGETPAFIEARSSARMLTTADRWSNLVRLTSAGVSGAVGGADAIVLGAFSDNTGPTDSFAARLARNTQLILMEEAHLGRVSDPAAGAWSLETLTRTLALDAWGRFQEIEAHGGLVPALRSGLLSARVAIGRDALRAALNDGGLRIVGVTDFRAADPIDDVAPPPAPAPAPGQNCTLPGPDGACPAMPPIRLETLAL